MRNKKNIFIQAICNSINILWILIEHILNTIFMILVILILTIVFYKKTGETSLASMIFIGIVSGIIASILIQSKIDLRECKKDAFKIIALWNEFYYQDYGSPKFLDNDDNNDIINHINNKYKTISEINNLMSNKYSFELFECNVDKTICNFIRKLELQLGPYRDKSYGALYAYAVMTGLCTSIFDRNNETYSYINAIGNIICACINTHSPICRAKLIYKKSGIHNKEDFNKVIKYIEHMNKEILCNQYMSEQKAFHKTLNELYKEIEFPIQ